MVRPRVRVAPSPTGVPHIGFSRTALYNWLFAQKNKGKFIVRIEDTDRARLVPKSLPKILESLRWLGLDWDEGPEVGGPHQPYVQSKRLKIYQKHSEKLVKIGAAYHCFCTPARLAKLRREQQKAGQPPKYDRHCLNLTKKEVAQKIKAGKKYVIRLKVPDSGKTSWSDLIHGKISFDNSTIDDQILLKSDGFPTYHLGVVVDDHLMRITHVLRGNEWISSTPKHIILFKAFGWKLPRFGHLPLIFGPDKSKLSKRHGARDALSYRDEGYLPEAIVNYLLLLGWSPGDDREIFSREEAIAAFDLKGIASHNPVFTQEKLDWFNGVYIRKKSDEELVQLIKPFAWKGISDNFIKKTIPLVRDRLVRLSDYPSLLGFLVKPIKYPRTFLLQEGKSESQLREVLKSVLAEYERLGTWTADTLEVSTRRLAEEMGWKPGDLFMAIRVAVTGKTATPPLFETLELMERDRTLRRLRRAVNKLS